MKSVTTSSAVQRNVNPRIGVTDRSHSAADVTSIRLSGNGRSSSSSFFLMDARQLFELVKSAGQSALAALPAASAALLLGQRLPAIWRTKLFVTVSAHLRMGDQMYYTMTEADKARFLHDVKAGEYGLEGNELKFFQLMCRAATIWCLASESERFNEANKLIIDTLELDHAEAKYVLDQIRRNAWWVGADEQAFSQLVDEGIKFRIHEIAMHAPSHT